MSAGAVGAAPVVCKTDWCSNPSLSRGMCGNCYSRWRRANPGLRIHRLNEDLIEELLPSRAKALAEKSGLDYNTVRAVLIRLHKAGRAKIGHWDPPHVTGDKFLAVWVVGKGVHARKPGKQKRHDYGNKTRRERVARQQGRLAPPPTASWMGPLAALMGE